MGDMAKYYGDMAFIEQDLLGQIDVDEAFNRNFRLRRKGMRDDMKRSLLASELKKNKFYVGSNSVFSRNWGHPTVEAAVKHAEELLEDRDDDVFVVQIVRLVRRKPAPVEVKKVP